MADTAVPNLPARDFTATIAFYGAFGFTVADRTDDWLVLRRNTLQLEFFPSPDLDPATSSFMCSIRVDDVDSLYAQIRGAGVVEAVTGIPRLVPIELRPWGQRAGYLVDLDGTQLHLIGNAK